MLPSSPASSCHAVVLVRGGSRLSRVVPSPQDIAKFLPHRSENNIKNHWYAAGRAKADTKHGTFLWVYIDLIDRHNKPPSLETLSMALQQYRAMQWVTPLTDFVVDIDYFTSRQGRMSVAAAAAAASASAASKHPHGRPPAPLTRPLTGPASAAARAESASAHEAREVSRRVLDCLL